MTTFTIKTAWNNFGRNLERISGMNREEFEQDFEQFKSMQPKGSVNDYLWGLFNRLIMENAHRPQTQSSIYHLMSVFISRYEGKNSNQYTRLRLAQEVFMAQQQIKDGQGKDVILELAVIPDPDCEHAKSVARQRFPITDDLVLPLANKDCTRDLCRCSTSVSARRDENGRVIYTDRPKLIPKKKPFWEFWK
ncbi:hypothetical protein [Flagellimonas profundi]|uniref:Uncharacterized protein n=1 Tax=Flagellimonas profundi TaxID=2915620 RepID=A0ABS3FDD0_9FLAO|nr:hypothetical protein [Allomuricauda profundi]MBO0340942.1 hypothetical protein [Allomuricauda profundi]